MYVDPDPECDEEGWGEARSTAAAVAVTATAGAAYVAAYGFDRYLTYTDHLGPDGAVLQFAVMAAVLVCHEAVHAVAYRTVAGVPWSAIAVELSYEGGLDPIDHSVHPTRPVRRGAYYACVLAPTLLLGGVPTAVALATGNSLAMFVGALGLLLVGTDVGALVGVWRREPTAAADPA